MAKATKLCISGRLAEQMIGRLRSGPPMPNHSVPLTKPKVGMLWMSCDVRPMPAIPAMLVMPVMLMCWCGANWLQYL